MGVGVIININIGGRLDGLYLFIKALEVRARGLIVRGHVDRKKSRAYVRTVLSVRNLFLREESSWQR
jgi:hypothetical protein